MLIARRLVAINIYLLLGTCFAVVVVFYAAIILIVLGTNMHRCKRRAARARTSASGTMCGAKRGEKQLAVFSAMDASNHCPSSVAAVISQREQLELDSKGCVV